MSNYKDSEENICLRATELLDSLNSHPGSEYQFANGCLDVFREFFQSLGVRSISHPVFVQLYQNYQQVIEDYRGKIDLSKIERSFNKTLEHHKISLDDLASHASLQTPAVNRVSKTVKRESNGDEDTTGYKFTDEYARKLDEEKRKKERRVIESPRRNGRRVIIDIAEKAGLSAGEESFAEKIRLENYAFVNKSLARVKGLYNVLSEIYEDCKLSEDGEFNERFFESWLDFRKEVVFLRAWSEYNRKIKSFAGADRKEHQMLLDKVVENINEYKGSPQQLFERDILGSSTFVELDGFLSEEDSSLFSQTGGLTN